MGTLSVRENLTFSAALRLRASIKAAERKERINKVIKELGLEKCADTKVIFIAIYIVNGTILFTTYIVCLNLNTHIFVLFCDKKSTGRQ